MQPHELILSIGIMDYKSQHRKISITQSTILKSNMSLLSFYIVFYSGFFYNLQTVLGIEKKVRTYNFETILLLRNTVGFTLK